MRKGNHEEMGSKRMMEKVAYSIFVLLLPLKHIQFCFTKKKKKKLEFMGRVK